MSLIRPSRVLLRIIALAVLGGLTFAQDTTATGSASANSTAAASNTGTPTTITTSPDTPVSAGSGNTTTISPDTFTATQKQLGLQLFQQLPAATPEQRMVLVNNFRQQLNVYVPAIETSPATDSQMAQQAAMQTAFVQYLPAADKQAYGLMQQRQQLAQQMATSTPEQRQALVGQINSLVTQQAALNPLPAGAPSDPNAITQVQTTWVSTLPPENQIVVQAQLSRMQAIQSAMQLPPEQRLAAFQTIIAQPLPVTGNTTTSASGTSTGNTTVNSSTLAPVSPPPAGP